MDRAEICRKDQQQFVTIQARVTFDESQRLCLGVGGVPAVGEDDAELKEMIESFNNSNCERGFYGGFTDRQLQISRKSRSLTFLKIKV